LKTADYFVLGLAAIPAIYYVLVLYSTARFFLSQKKQQSFDSNFTPPISNLKPVRGLDLGAYENFASFCRQDYPEYELLFCVDQDDPAAPVIEKLKKDFPDCQIRIFYGSGRDAPNDKVARLARLSSEAKYDVFVMSDSDVYAEPDYFRTLVAPLSDPKVGATTCLYMLGEHRTFTQRLQSTSMLSDFYPGIFVAKQLDGVKFALGTTIAARRKNLEDFGGYAAIEDRPGDDLHVGRLIAEQGYEVALLPYTIHTVADFQSTREFLHKRFRWMMAMRNMRPWGHLGLIFTFGLPWSVVAFAAHPTWEVAAAYFGCYAAFRMAMTWMVGIWGMKQRGVWSMMPLIPLWDAQAFVIWVISFFRTTIRWRGIDYHFANEKFLRVAPNPGAD